MRGIINLMIYSPKLQKAINIATQAHSGQIRKGKPYRAYITHPLTVGLILARTGADENIIIAGILHDSIEDTHVTKAEIEKEFGGEVAEMVNDVTEQDKTLPWVKRKSLAQEHIPLMGNKSLLVKSADLLHNLTDIIEDYRKEGEEIFKIFHAPKKMQLERYKELICAIEKAWKENPLLPELRKALSEIERLWG